MLLSAYDFGGENSLLLMAKKMGYVVYMVFETPNEMPDKISLMCSRDY
jgi:hypothetical protein